MPPIGKAQLSNAEKTLIYWWLNSGGKEDHVLGKDSKPDSIQTALNESLSQIAARQTEKILKKEELDRLARVMRPELTRLGFVVEFDPESDSSLFAISMRLPPKKITDETLVKLLPYSHAISKISLVSGEITDDGLYTLSQMSALRHLVLAKTCIKGEGIPYLARLPKLEVLNLSETSVNNLSIFHLMDLPQLKTVYLYNSEVSVNVVEALNAYLPDTKIINQEGDLY